MKFSKKVLINYDGLSGFIFSALLFLSYINLQYFLPIVFFFFIITSKGVDTRINKMGVLLFLCLVSALFVTFFFKYGENLKFEIFFIYHMAVLFFANYTFHSKMFLDGFIIGLILFSFFDLIINVYSYFGGSDPFGRLIDIREEDGKFRLNGLLGHPFLSVCVSLLGYIAGRTKGNIIWMLLPLLNLVLNEAGRSQLIFIVIIIIEVLLFFSKKNIIIKGSFLAVTIIICSIYYLIKSDLSSNILRVSIWFSVFDDIIKNPFIGSTNFSWLEPNSGVSLDRIIESGGAENQLLELALHLGIPITILFLFLIVTLFRKSYNLKLNNRKYDEAYFIFTFVILVDIFLGNIFITSLAVVSYSVFFSFQKCHFK